MKSRFIIFFTGNKGSLQKYARLFFYTIFRAATGKRALFKEYYKYHPEFAQKRQITLFFPITTLSQFDIQTHVPSIFQRSTLKIGVSVFVHGSRAKAGVKLLERKMRT